MSFGPQFPSATSQNSSHTFNIASFIGVEGEHFGDHLQHSRPTCERLCLSHTWNFFIAVSIHHCATWLMSSLVISAAKHITNSSVLSPDIFYIDATTHTHTHTQSTNKQTNVVMPLQVVQRRNYFCDESMSGNNSWDRKFPHKKFLYI